MVFRSQTRHASRRLAVPRLRAGILWVAFLLTAGFVQDVLAANTYRYKDDSGRIIHGSTVPPQFVKNGYEILNERGVVIQTIPRALTPAEIAAQEAQQAEREAAEALARQQQEADSLLLRLYRSPDEIARKRDERVTIIDGQITALLASLQKVETEVAKQQKLVDDQKTAGEEPSPQTVEALRIQTEERDRLVALRERLDSDRSTALADAARDMKRLAELLGLPPPVGDAAADVSAEDSAAE